ncbi:hypothetical protein E2P81_ATG08484 [Venturia nashicola]|uniref:Uncharacterized protein n=1 Tax=Venturia nashicola TaxID=86259 RepID=A0A4Z1P2H0_9PEZI|nr:hypothetical protein E6O75_ATG08678 [Venturia nashicola]TLD20820.1 hypothetical protein E2P81_ATG08484 [Venturia nashicola]
MASYSAIPLQYLNPGHFHEEINSGEIDPKIRAKVASQRVSGGSFDGSSDTKLPRTQNSPRRAGYGRLASAWWQEIVSFLFAAACFVAIAIILAKYNGQEQPDWKYSLNLSTLVAILSTLLRTSLVVVVEEIVGQLKWLWYKTTRPLRHLSDFDQAARSPWGSLLLPFRIKRVNLALLGALIVVLSLAIGPFTQQAIKNVSCETDLPFDKSGNSNTSRSTAKIPIAHQVLGSSATRYGAGLWSMASDVKGAIVNGLSDPTGNLSAVSAVCGTGNCTFPDYSSAGMCSKCIDVTSLITEVLFNQTNSHSSVPFSNLTLPNGLSIGNSPSDQPSQWLNISTDSNLEWAQISDSAMLAGLSASIYNFTLLQITDANCSITVNSTNKFGTVSYNYDCPQHGKNFSPGWRNYGFLATSCAIFPCAKTYHSNVTNGVLDEQVLAEVPLLEDLSQPASAVPDQVAFKSPCVVEGQSYDLSNISKVPSLHRSFNTTEINGKNVTVPSECFYSVSGIWSRALTLFLGTTLAGFCYLPDTNGYPMNIDPRYRTAVRCATDFFSQTATADSWWLQELFNNGNATFGSVETSVDAIASAVTNKIRTFGSNWDGSQGFATGSSTRTTICTQVDWPWLIFPAILLALTLFLLIIIALRTIFGHGDVPIWKSSLLPLIFASKEPFTAKSGDLRDIDDAADDTLVELKRKGDEWQFTRPDGATSSGFDADNSGMHAHHHHHHHDWPGPSSNAFL